MKSGAKVFFLLSVLLLLLPAGTTLADSADKSESGLSTTDEWSLKRQIMSRPGVMFDMANLTDNGYQWTNDVVWVGTAQPEVGNWYIAGFVFERPRFKSVWLQYAFTVDEDSGDVASFKRWFGSAAFR